MGDGEGGNVGAGESSVGMGEGEVGEGGELAWCQCWKGNWWKWGKRME